MRGKCGEATGLLDEVLSHFVPTRRVRACCCSASAPALEAVGLLRWLPEWLLSCFRLHFNIGCVLMLCLASWWEAWTGETVTHLPALALSFLCSTRR